jgi:putative transcriptional regulator
MYTSMNSLKGSLLIAAPGLMDPNFARTVVFIAEHNDEGALGLVLNRPAATKVSELWAAISEAPSATDAPAYVGGPVQANAVLLLHGHSDLNPAGEQVIPGVYLASEVELLGQLLERGSSATEGGAPTAAQFRVFCGYAGWGAGQLEGEMESGGWLTCSASAQQVFQSAPEQLWSTALRSLGGVYEFFSLMPPNPEMN